MMFTRHIPYSSGSQPSFKATQTYWKNQMYEISRPMYILIWVTSFLRPKNETAVAVPSPEQTKLVVTNQKSGEQKFAHKN